MKILSGLQLLDEGNFAENDNENSIHMKAVDEMNVILNKSTLYLNEMNYTSDVASNLINFDQLLYDRFNFKLLQSENSKMYEFKIKISDDKIFYIMMNNSHIFSIHGIKKAAIVTMAKSVISNLINTLFA